MKNIATSEKKNWAYGALAMNNAELGVGTIYYAEKYFTSVDPENVTITNPVSAEKYTVDEINEIILGADKGGEKYVSNVPAGAVMGISANGTEKVFWYDESGAKAILSHADALVLNVETGVMTTAADGTEVANPRA